MSAAIWRDRFVLPGGQLEGKEPADAGVDAGIGLQRRRGGLALLRLPLHRQGQLQDQQFLISEPPPGLGQFRRIGGKMDLRQRLPQGPKIFRARNSAGKTSSN